MMKRIVTILFLVASVASVSTGWAGDVEEQDVIIARRDAERAARQAINEAKSKIALIPGIPKAELKMSDYTSVQNRTFFDCMREHNDLLRQQNAILLRIADVIAPLDSTNIVQKLEKE
jgi:hypothetical protein